MVRCRWAGRGGGGRRSAYRPTPGAAVQYYRARSRLRNIITSSASPEGRRGETTHWRCTMQLRIGDEAPDFTAETTAGHDPFPRMDRQRLGDPVLPSQGLHAGVHHRAGLHGPAEARVRQAQHQDHRPERRPGRATTPAGPKDIEETQGHGAELPDDRRPRPEGREALRHAARRRRRRLRRPRTPADNADRAHGVHHRPRQEDQADPHLSDDDRPQFRRGAARARFACSSPRSTRSRRR